MQASLERLRKRHEDGSTEGGFTLIELLIVIVILGILAAIVVFAVQNLTSSSAQASCSSDYKTVESGLEAYKAQMGSYPNGGGIVVVSGAVATASTTHTDDTATTANAAGSTTSPLLVASSTATSGTGLTTNMGSPSGSQVGPWLKDVPSNAGHYYIWADNNGDGKIFVGTGTAGATAPTAATCSAAGVN